MGFRAMFDNGLIPDGNRCTSGENCCRNKKLRLGMELGPYVLRGDAGTYL